MSITKTPPQTDNHKDDDNVERVVSLLPFEVSIPIMHEQFSTASLTWYQLDKGQTLEDVATSTQNRLTAMLEANPWLGGRIKTRKGAAAIVYTPAQSKQQADRILQVYTTKEMGGLSMETPYPKASALLQKTVVPLTYFWLWGRDAPFFRVALVPDSKDATKFALITSLAHCVGDGKTYYNLHNMMAHNTPIVALNIDRKEHLHHAMVKSMGGPNFFGCYCYPTLGMLVRIVRSVVLAFVVGPRTVVKLCHVNPQWIQEQKKLGLVSNSSEYKPNFLSSNDVMASSFLKIVGCDQAFMTVNFRGKIPDCHEHDAGNYYNFNPLRWADFGTPVGVRKVVDQLKLGQRHPTTQPLTSWGHFVASLSTPLAFFTNWADFQRPVPLQQCQQLLHMPLVPTHSFKMPARLFSICYVFKPTKECDKLGVLVSATPKAMQALEATGMMGPELLQQTAVESLQ